jgi:hypothetical protein
MTDFIAELRQQKRARFQMLLEWEGKRSADSGKYKTILSNLAFRILQKVTISKEANMAVVKFLKEKRMNCVHLSDVLLAEIDYLPDPQHPRLTTSLAAGLSAVSDYQRQMSTSLLSLSQKIE